MPPKITLEQIKRQIWSVRSEEFESRIISDGLLYAPYTKERFFHDMNVNDFMSESTQPRKWNVLKDNKIVVMHDGLLCVDLSKFYDLMTRSCKKVFTKIREEQKHTPTLPHTYTHTDTQLRADVRARIKEGAQ